MTKRKSAALVCAAAIVVVLVACGGGGGGGSQPTYSISGTVLSGETGLADVAVAVIGQDRMFETITDGSGNFTVSGVPNGDYTIVGSKSMYTCGSVTRTVNGANVDNVIITASSDISKSLLICDNVGLLARMDIDTGELELIGTMRLEDGGVDEIVMTDIAMDPSGTLYGVDNAYLYRIDNANAAVTIVGPHGLSYPSSLVFNELGVLYAATNTLYTLDRDTGAATFVGYGGIPYRSSGDLAFLVNNLYLTSNVTPGDPGLIPDNLVTLNPVDGRAALVGSTNFPDVYGLATNDRIRLYAVSGTKILTIDPGTGAGTELYDYAGNSLGLGAGQGLAFE